MKKIIISAFTIFAVVAAVAGATAAVFSDTETSVGNTFAAGTLDLEVNGENDPDVVHINMSDMKPGDGVGGAEHSTIVYNYTLSNVGSITGNPWIEITNLVNDDNTCTEPEDDDGDTTCGPHPDGELGANLYMQINAPGNPGFIYPNDSSCLSGRSCPINLWAGMGTIGGSGAAEPWPDIPGGGSLAPMVLEFQIPTSVGNEIQSDSVEFDIVFHLDQV